jgi:chromatin structure-remodeling complex protein RSC7
MPERQGELRQMTVVFDARANICSRFNTTLAAARQDNNQGHYDVHTNTIQWPRSMQPTHARWENAELDGADGRENDEGKLVDEPNADGDDTDKELCAHFKKLDPVYPRNFMIHDLYLKGAGDSRFGPPGLDHDPQSLSSLPSDILDELPPDCRQTFEEAKNREISWRSRWSTEMTDGKRGRFLPTSEWFP